jgi:transcriptional adapter 3
MAAVAVTTSSHVFKRITKVARIVNIAKNGTETPAKSPGKSSSHKAHRNASKDPDSASSSLSPVEQTTPVATGIMDAKAGSADAEDSDSSDDHQPPPAPTIAHVQTFGDDPSTFPDPTIYEIRQIKHGMSDEEIKEIYSVADYPHNDLHDLIPGTPPDKDFSNAKPSNQVQATTFATYLEPYFRPFTEEDLAFLRERGDRVSPFVIPRRGKKHYTEVWAEEDGAMAIDTPKQDRDKLPANQARGSIEDIDDSVAETDQVSAGPILSRLLATLRPEHRAPPSDDKATTNGILNGDYSLNGDINGDMHEPNLFTIDEPPPPIPPATYMPESSSETWKKSTHPKLDHAQVDERIKQELRHIGFLPFDEEPDFDGHFDDEIAARLRLLQAQLKEQAIINGARKARMMDLVKERMAHQEYTTILEDLDGQVQSAYMKRTRSMGKNKKTKRPGGAGGGSHFVGPGSGMARPGIGDMTKTLMERRKKWIDNIGPVFGNEKSLGMVPRVSDEGSSIFKPEDIAEYNKREREAWDEDVEEE